MVTKGHTYLKKPETFSCRFVEAHMTFFYKQALKSLTPLLTYESLIIKIHIIKQANNQRISHFFSKRD